MSKWKVERGNSRYYNPPTCWDVYDHNGGFWRSFDSHAEALACADGQARARRYVLPPVDDTTTIDEDDLEIMIFSIADHICITQPRLSEPSEIDVVAITPEFAEEVALALLAHAERIEE